MSIIGEIKKGHEINKCPSEKYIWQACDGCGRERWVLFIKQMPVATSCPQCANLKRGIATRGDRHHSWKGGRITDKNGYIQIKLQHGDFFYSMTNHQGYVFEHRLIIAKHFKRCLQSWEIVHHKNHIRDDNRLENLQLIQEMQHHQVTILEKKLDKLIESQQELKQEIRLLRLENRNLKEQIKR